tara:strand:+ start:768 stop:1685 length:918 start_codon:yes stop_codon:yes gene_type:complete
MQLLKQGSTGPDVEKLQKILLLPVDGIFGRYTKDAVKKFQLHNNIKVDGIVGNVTWQLLVIVKVDTEAINEDTDIGGQWFTTNYGQKIHKYYLSKSEYLKKPGASKYMFLHHTAGGSNPYACIDNWSRDRRGRVSTEFVLGGQNYRTEDAEYDGIMTQAFPEDGYGWHLGETGSGYMNRHSIGLEICSIGYLDSEYKSYVGKKAHPDQVIKLEKAFRGQEFWHKYSSKQVEETQMLLKYIQERDSIDMRIGLQQLIKKYGPTKAFEFQEDAYYGKIQGLISHSNVRKDKMDVYPDPDMIDMIMSF